MDSVGKCLEVLISFVLCYCGSSSPACNLPPLEKCVELAINTVSETLKKVSVENEACD